MTTRSEPPANPSAVHRPFPLVSFSAEGDAPTKLAIFGSTGSIGCSTLDLAARHNDRFEVVALVAGKNLELLVEQAKTFRPRWVGIGDERLAPELRRMLADRGVETEIAAGEVETAELAARPELDTVVAGIVGNAGLRSTFAAARAGKRILLANKESIVAAGALLETVVRENRTPLVPVDSEHSAVFQLLRNESPEDVVSVQLTASGGPFRQLPMEKLAQVTPAQAVRHPNWSMGAKISIDSASMMNKALEVIEAAWLFGLTPEEIEVVVHPGSIVHSLVRLRDGTQLAQLSVPDMRGPIAYALGYPGRRLETGIARLDLGSVGSLEFEALDDVRFPAVALAKRCLASRSAASAVFTIANECAVRLFSDGAISFPEIVSTVERAVERFGTRTIGGIEELIELEHEVRRALDRPTESGYKEAHA